MVVELSTEGVTVGVVVVVVVESLLVGGVSTYVVIGVLLSPV